MLQQELTSNMSLQIGYIGSEAYHNMFESSPSYNANEQTLAGFDQINPETGQIYTKAERSPFYNGTAQRELGVKYGTPIGGPSALTTWQTRRPAATTHCRSS